MEARANGMESASPSNPATTGASRTELLRAGGTGVFALTSTGTEKSRRQNPPLFGEVLRGCITRGYDATLLN